MSPCLDSLVSLDSLVTQIHISKPHALSQCKCLKNDLSLNFEKVIKIKVRIISKPHAYLKSMVMTSVKFQKNRNITVGEVACTRYSLSIQFHCQNVRNK